jgi:hypothetical protein
MCMYVRIYVCVCAFAQVSGCIHQPGIGLLPPASSLALALTHLQLRRAQRYAIDTREAARRANDHAQELVADMYLTYQLYEAAHYAEALVEFEQLRQRALTHNADEVVRMLDSAIFRSRRELRSQQQEQQCVLPATAAPAADPQTHPEVPASAERDGRRTR